MPNIKVEGIHDDPDYFIEKVVMDNTPELGDVTGQVLLDQFANAISQARESIDKGYRLTDFWSNPDVGVEFILKKKKDN
ncbi:hypothetical protein JCM39194_17790 [Desulfotomaculum varum]